MWNVSPINLKNQSVFIRELTIGEAMQIAKIPHAMNEARISSFIGFVCDDNHLADTLTAQERYFILLNYLSLAENDYVLNLDDASFFLPNTQAPDDVKVGNITVSQLTGNMAVALEQKCENVYEWLVGQMVCQLSGDLGVADLVWEPMRDGLDDEIQQRFEQVESLSVSDFERLVAVYYEGCDKLAHCVRLGMDNDGLTLMSVGGETEQVARFCPHLCFTPTAEQLSQCFVE